MLRWFKNHFIPHKGNGHQPHFLRAKNTRRLILAVFMLELVVLVMPFIPKVNFSGNSYLAAVLPGVLDDLTNRNRQSQNLAVLKVNPLLNKAAELKAVDMAQNHYFAHTSPEGKTPWYWFKQVGYKYEYAGENLAIDFNDSQDVTLAWMNSPTHRANIVKNSYTEIGTGVATGTFDGNSTVFVAQVYGKPAVDGVPSVPEQGSIDSVAVAANPIIETSPRGKVIGATTEAVNNADPIVLVPPIASASVTDQKSIETNGNASIIERYLTSPRHVANIILGILAILVVLALIFKVFIRMDKKHPRLIMNGLIVLALIFGVYVANNYMAKRKLATKTSFASFHAEQLDQ